MTSTVIDRELPAVLKIILHITFNALHVCCMLNRTAMVHSTAREARFVAVS
jgi:hypothetical protein